MGQINILSTDGTHKAGLSFTGTSDISVDAGNIATKDNPVFTGTPTAPTATAGNNSTQISTTAFVKAKSELDSIGVGQTWQDVTTSRAVGVTYTNSTGKPIMVHILCNTLSASAVNVIISGIAISANAYGSAGTGVSVIYVIVPNGATYVTTTTNITLNKWTELR